jgi:Putative peptidoglycan binding domain
MSVKSARLSIVEFNLSHNGLYNGSGYPGHCPNEACQYLGRPCEFSCADGYTFVCKHQGYALPSMQPGLATGFASCYYGFKAAKAKKALIPSWEGKPGDAWFVNTGNGSQPGHVEMIYDRVGTEVHTFGWDSGPSNVDGFTGQGGCHKHVWSDPKGQGNARVMGALDLSKVVDLSKKGKEFKPAKKNSGNHLLMVKSPLMGSPKGSPLIEQVQHALNRHNDGPHIQEDGVYGIKTEKAVRAFEKHEGLHVDGIVGPHVYAKLGVDPTPRKKAA